VTFEVADSQYAPALTSVGVPVAAGRRPTWRVASAVVGARVLPPGRYVVRAHVTRDGKPVGVLARPFVLERPEAIATPPSASPAAVLSFASSLPKFDPASTLSPDLLGAMLDMVERRGPGLKEALIEARAGRYGPAALEALTAGDQAAAAFLRGLDYFVKGQLDQAATQLQLAAGPRREFFPAAFYLGACFAAVGRDRDAAGVWQLSLGSEARPVAVHLMAADARMRHGQAASAIDILGPAYERNPGNDEIARRLAMAYALTGRYAEALPVLDSYLGRHASDEDMLFAFIASQYEAVRAGQVLSNIDRDKLRKYSAAYRGPDQALVTKYLAVMEVR
jgi:Flp pilus assembly protein TadD